MKELERGNEGWLWVRYIVYMYEHFKEVLKLKSIVLYGHIIMTMLPLFSSKIVLRFQQLSNTSVEQKDLGELLIMFTGYWGSPQIC